MCPIFEFFLIFKKIFEWLARTRPLTSRRSCARSEHEAAAPAGGASGPRAETGGGPGSGARASLERASLGRASALERRGAWVSGRAGLPVTRKRERESRRKGGRREREVKERE